MATWLRISRGILTLVGAIPLLSSIGTLTSGSNVDIVLILGPLFGLAVLGAAWWTTARGLIRALVVWLGVAAVAIGAVVLFANAGPMQTRDLIVYVGIPTLIVLLATVTVAVARVRAGALGS